MFITLAQTLTLILTLDVHQRGMSASQLWSLWIAGELVGMWVGVSEDSPFLTLCDSNATPLTSVRDDLNTTHFG